MQGSKCNRPAAIGIINTHNYILKTYKVKLVNLEAYWHSCY